MSAARKATPASTALGKRMLGEILVEHGQVTQQQLSEALLQQRVSGKRLGALLVELGALDERVLADALGEHFGLSVVEALATAERPVLYAGGGVLSARATSELAALAEALDVPVAHTLMGKGCLREDHPLGPAGTILRGHEFHYATGMEDSCNPPFADMTDAYGGDWQPAGSRLGNASGTFFHLIARDS